MLPGSYNQIDMLKSVITGTGAYIPTTVQPNSAFLKQTFYSKERKVITKPAEEIVAKLHHATGIVDRRYAPAGMRASDMGLIAAKQAIEDSGVDPETIDQLIVAHNFGDINENSVQSTLVPSLATRIKHGLGIVNPACVAYDLLFGCPGWIQTMIHADAFFKAGIARKILLVATESLSRVIDHSDMDSMIFADGAGATVLEAREADSEASGILSSSALTHTVQEAYYINTDTSYNPEEASGTQYLKMNGRKVYEYALKQVPLAMKDCMDKSGQPISALKKIFIHQANEKMDDAIVKRFFELYDLPAPQGVMPMSIHWLGNSSVATIPTLLDLVRRGQLNEHELVTGDIILFASVGAGMNINAVCYRY